MDQRELIQALTERSDGALEQLWLHYGPLIRYIINPILPDERDREEALSDVLLRVWDRIEQYDPDRGSWTGWLGIIARNAAVDRARALPPRSKELAPDIPAPHSDPEAVPRSGPSRDGSTASSRSCARHWEVISILCSSPSGPPCRRNCTAPPTSAGASAPNRPNSSFKPTGNSRNLSNAKQGVLHSSTPLFNSLHSRGHIFRWPS